MRQSLHHLTISTKGKSLVEITRPVAEWLAASGITTGLLTAFVRHTSCSLLIQENADPDVRRDLMSFFDDLAPETRDWVHDAEGPDDMPAHAKSALTQTQLAIPIESGRPVLGTWQGIYLFEHRTAPHRRDVVLHAIGN